MIPTHTQDIGDADYRTAMLARREAAFRYQWLPKLNPAKKHELKKMPLSMLQELYPQVWRYGPNAATFARQLTALTAYLDRYDEEDGSSLLNTMYQHYSVTSPMRYKQLPDIDHVLREQGRALDHSFTDPVHVKPLPKPLIMFMQHPIWTYHSKHPMRDHRESFMLDFTWSSLHQDVIRATYPANLPQNRRHLNLCRALGLPQ